MSINLSQEERWDIYDLIPVLEMKIWPNEEERETFGKTYFEWSTILGHPPQDNGRGCQTCGWGISCIFDVFFEGVIETTMYQLSELGVLK